MQNVLIVGATHFGYRKSNKLLLLSSERSTKYEA